MSRILRITVGIVFMLISITALVKFDYFLSFFVLLSPDGRIVPFMQLLLKLSLISSGGVALALIFSRYVIRALAWADGLICSSYAGGFLRYTLAVGFILRLATVIFMPFNQTYDYQRYDDLGWEWAATGGYFIDGHPTAYWPPGYPFLLSRIYVLFGHWPQLAATANILLGLSIPLLSYFIVRRIWSENLARWTMVIATVFPSQVLFTHLLASEMLFTPLLLLSVLLFLSFDRKMSGRWYQIIAGGIVLGLATLTRVISKAFLVLVIPFWLWESRDIGRTLRYGLLAVAGFFLVVAPWMIRNYDAFGVACINTNSGINLFIGNQPGAGFTYNRNLEAEYDIHDPTIEAYVDSSAWHRARDYIFDNPGIFLYRGVLKTGYFYASDMDALYFGVIEAAERSATNHAVLLAILAQSYYLLILLSALLGLVVFLRSDRSVRNPGGFFLLGIVLYWTAVHFVFYGVGRYHFPIIPIISAFAALYIRRLVENLRKSARVAR